MGNALKYSIALLILGAACLFLIEGRSSVDNAPGVVDNKKIPKCDSSIPDKNESNCYFVVRVETDPDKTSGIDWVSLNEHLVEAGIPAKPTGAMNIISETYNCADNAHWSGWHKSDRLNINECVCDTGYTAESSGETLTCGETASSKT